MHYNNQYDGNYCNIVSDLSENHADASIKIFPNPTSSYLNIESDFDQLTVSIYNCLGQKLNTYLWSGTPLDVRSLQKGYYIVDLWKGKKRLGTTNFVKQ